VGVVASVVVGALLASLVGITKADEPPRDGIVWTGDFESGDLTGFYWHQNQPEVVTAPHPVRAGEYAMRSYLHRYESEWSYRTEVIVGADPQAPPDQPGEYQFHIGDEYWIGLSIYVPDDLVVDTERLSDVVFQMQASPDPGEDYRSPVFGLDVDADRWRIYSRWDTRRTSPPGNDFTGQEIVYSGPLGSSIGRWTDWVVHVVWSWGDDGLLQVWRDADLVVDRTGPNCSNDEAGPHPAFGLYKWSWRDDSYVHNTDWRLFYHDEFRIGDWRASYQDVAPGAALPSATGEPTPTATQTPGATHTPTPTATQTPIPIATHTPTPTATHTPTPTATHTPTPMATPEPTTQAAPTVTPSRTATLAPTITPGATPTSQPTATPTLALVTLRLPSVEGEPHDLLVVPISVDNARDLFSLDVTVGFDQNVLRARGAHGDGLTADWPASSVVSPGAISLSLASGGTAINGSGVVGVLEFEVLANAGEACSLSVLAASLNHGSLVAYASDGVFEAEEGSRFSYLPMVFGGDPVP